MDTRTIALPTLTFSLLAFSIIVFSALAASARAQEVPIPTLTPYVTDLAGVIEPQYADAINNYASQLDASTTAQIAVLTVNSTQPMSIEEYAVDVFAQNGIGQKGVDNGVLVVVAVADRQWKIEVGYGLEGVLNDAKVSRIGRQYLSAYFVNGSYGEGTYLTVKALGDVIAGNDTTIPSDYGTYYDITPADIAPLVLPIALVLLIFAAISVAAYVNTHRCPKCGGWMKCTDTDTQTCCTCPKCGYKKCKKRSRVPFFFFYGGTGSGGGGWSGGGGGGGFGGGGSGGGGGGGSW